LGPETICVFLHLRKAGGTTLRAVLQRAAEHHGIEARMCEGSPVSWLDVSPTTFLVANFRDPLDRVRSLYQPGGDYPAIGSNNHIPFDQWLEPTTEIQNPRAPVLWRSVSDYYVRTFGAPRAGTVSSREIRQREMTQEDYRAACWQARAQWQETEYQSAKPEIAARGKL
jgi:hypothetical protein